LSSVFSLIKNSSKGITMTLTKNNNPDLMMVESQA